MSKISPQERWARWVEKQEARFITQFNDGISTVVGYTIPTPKEDAGTILQVESDIIHEIGLASKRAWDCSWSWGIEFEVWDCLILGYGYDAIMDPAMPHARVVTLRQCVGQIRAWPVWNYRDRRPYFHSLDDWRDIYRKESNGEWREHPGLDMAAVRHLKRVTFYGT